MSSRTLTIPKGEWKGFNGYNSNARNASIRNLCPPSRNCMINLNGDAETRLGFVDTGWDLGHGLPTKPFFHQTYNISIFIGGLKVQYVDHNTGDTIIDTGATVSADTVTRPAEYLGDLYYTNTTDGLKRGVFGRLNDANADSGDGSVFVDSDMAARLSVFGKTSGDIVIAGVSFAYNAVVISTGEITLDGVTLTQDFDDNTVVFVDHDISAGIELFSKILFWKERLHGMGFPSATNADQPNNTVMAGKFVIGQTGASGIEDIIDFSFGSGGSTKITVGKGGRLTNILGVKDFIHFFKEERSYDTNKDDITTSGAAIGLTIPVERDELHGCLNEDSAISVGNNEIGYISNDNRIMKQRISVASGAAVIFPDESFDSPLYLDLPGMDAEQPLAMAFYYKEEKLEIYQISISGQWFWYIFDNKIGFNPNTGRSGAWQPPQLVIPANGFFEKDGILYATDDATDTIYEVFTTFDDNGQPIQCNISSAEIDIGASMIKKAGGQGIITQGTDIEMKCFVTNKTAGLRSGSPKTVFGADYGYDPNRSIGANRIGGSTNAATVSIADWIVDFNVYPQEANRVQFEASCFGDHFSLSSFFITGDQYSDSFQRTL